MSIDILGTTMNYEVYAIRNTFQSLFQKNPELFEIKLRSSSNEQLSEITETMEMKLLCQGANRFFEDETIHYDEMKMTWMSDKSGNAKYFIKKIPHGWQINDYQMNPLFYYLQRHFKETLVIDEFRIVTIVKVEK